MENGRSHLFWRIANLGSPFRTVILVCLVATLSYLAASLGGALVLQHPRTVSPLWPGCVLLVSVLLLVRRRIWPILIAAAFAAFVLYDLQAGVPIRSTAWLILADTVEVLTAALCLSYFFDGMPRLNSVKALAQYSFFAVILAPFVGAFFGALATTGNYWTSWRISFFSEALAFLTLMPAILGWISKGPAWAKKSHAFYWEEAALLAALVFFGYITFATPGRSSPPALLYSLVPFLLWSALRFGSMGVSTSVIVIAFLSIWGAIHGRGPFTEPESINKVSSLQLFLFFTAAPFMVLAALVEERKRAEEALQESEARERIKVKELETLFDAAPIPILIATDAECKCIIANRAGCQLHHVPIGANFSRSAFPMEPLPFRIMRNGVEIPTEELPLQRAVATGIPVFGALSTLVLEDGTEHHMIGNAAPLFGEDGKPRGAVAAFVDISDRKRAEQSLRESEERFRLVANTAPVLIWTAGTDKLCTFFNKGWLDFTGRSMEQELGQGWASGVHPDDLERCLGIYSAAFDARVDFEMEYRLRRFDGKYRWILDYGVPRFESDGTFLGYVGSCIDITDRKLSEEVLLDMAGRLITAHEEERSRIARELHDDLSQRMALLGIGLEQFEQDMPGLSSKARKQLHNIAEIATEASSDIHNLSHQLHPSKLETLGLVATVGGLCRELSNQHALQIEFVHHDVPGQLQKDLTLCLFRIVQEGLRNVVKHSGATEARVELSGHGDGIDLCISDAGVGFDPESTMGKTGLGLISMRERVRLIGGELAVQSTPSHGTRISLRVPLSTTNGRVTGEPRAHRIGK